MDAFMGTVNLKPKTFLSKKGQNHSKQAPKQISNPTVNSIFIFSLEEIVNQDKK